MSSKVIYRRCPRVSLNFVHMSEWEREQMNKWGKIEREVPSSSKVAISLASTCGQWDITGLGKTSLNYRSVERTFGYTTGVRSMQGSRSAHHSILQALVGYIVFNQRMVLLGHILWQNSTHSPIPPTNPYFWKWTDIHSEGSLLLGLLFESSVLLSESDRPCPEIAGGS